MTDLDLAKSISKEVKSLIKENGLKKENGLNWKDFNIYDMDKPYKSDDDPDAQEDYIIIMIGDQDTDSEGRWVVQVHILVSIMLFDERHDGNAVILNVINQIDRRFSTKKILDGKYELEKEKHKRLNEECYPNYYEGDYITKWKLPAFNQEGIDELL